MNTGPVTTSASTRSSVRAFRDAVSAELSKMLSLPATWMTVAGTLALSAILSLFFAAQAGAMGAPEVDSLDVGMAALPYSQAGLFVLGVVVACSEYVGGQIRTTLIAIPSRITQRTAATVALICVALPAAAASVIVSVTATALTLGDAAAFADPSTSMRSVGNATIYLTLMVVLSAAVGSLTRRALPAAGALVLYLVVASPLLLGQDFAYVLPDIAGYTLWFGTAPDNAPSSPAAWAIVTAWMLGLFVPSVAVARCKDV